MPFVSELQSVRKHLVVNFALKGRGFSRAVIAQLNGGFSR
jgi:hypothetical protein